MTAQRLLFSWLVWLFLVVTPLTTAAVSLPLVSPAPQSQDRTPEWAQSQGHTQHEFFKETSSISQELRAQSERQSKKARIWVRRLEALLQDQQRSCSLKSLPVLTTRPVRFFFPRKLSPPSTSDDPFVS